MINWDKITAGDSTVINDIAVRALLRHDLQVKKMDLTMDLEAAHIAEPLDLVKLLNFRDGDFLHDVVGIINNIDRTTGALGNCFSPRCGSKI